MESDLKAVVIPNETCRRAGLGASCLPINQIGLFAYQKNKNKIDQPTPFAQTKISIFNLRQEVILFTPILRKLINEANGTFLSVQNLKKSDNADFKNDIIRLSRQYRSIIRACLENLNDEVVRAYGDNRDELQNYITVFYSVECIWHLCEVLFVDSLPGGFVLPHLLDWVRFHFPKYERTAATMLAGDLIGMEASPDYWETVIGSLLQGRIKVVRALLRQHTESDCEAFKIVDHCLKTMPIYNIFGGVSVNEFKMQWRNWVVDVQSKIDAKLFISNYNLNLIMKLTVGNEVAWGEIQQYCESWYELLAAWLFYTEPTVKTFELGQFAKQCITKMSIRNRMRHLDRVLLAAMEFDILQVIKEIQHMNENGWFVTHLTDLLFHCGQLENFEEKDDDFSSNKLRETFLLDYGASLAGHKSLWQVGLSYLDYCENYGSQVIKLLLERLPLDSELKTEKIVKEALNRNFLDVAQTICKVQGMKMKNRGRLGNALTWGLKSQDSIFVSYLADKFLRQYCENRILINVDLFDNLGSSLLISDRLIFLGKYYEFHKLYQNKQYKEAGNLLISLLDSKISPNYFLNILLTETIPLLECDDLIFTSNDTFVILQCLEENEKFIKLDDKMDVLRLAAARNLARAFLFEAEYK